MQKIGQEITIPFGLEMKAISSVAATKQQTNYKFNAGTNLESSFDINYYETYFREYDAQIGRFTGVDSKSEDALSISPYHFAINNPINFNDPLGSKYEQPSAMASIFSALRDYLLAGGRINDININGTGVDFVSFGGGGSSGDEDNLSVVGGSITSTTSGNNKSGQPGYYLNYSYSINDGNYSVGSHDYANPTHFKILNSEILGSIFIRDMTPQFTLTLEQTEKTFSAIKHFDLGLKYGLFYSFVKDGSPNDLKRGAYAEKKIGTYSIYNGQLWKFDDYGNYNYGVAAYFAEIPIATATDAAGFAQIEDNDEDWSNPFNFFDQSRDTEMINQGYSDAWNNFGNPL